MGLRLTRLLLVFILVITAYIVTGVVHYRAVHTLVQNQLAQRSQRLVALELQNLLTQTINAETGQRGFVITGREEYLTPFYEARTRIPESLAMLRQNLGSDAGQLQRLARIEQLHVLKLAELEQSIEARRQGGFSAAQAIVESNRGKAYMDEIRRDVAAMDDIERAKLADRALASATSANRTIQAIWIAGILDLGLLLLLFYVVRADALRREADAAQIANARMLLRNVIDGSPAVIYLKDLSGRLILANKEFERVFGAATSNDASDIGMVLEANAMPSARHDMEMIGSHTVVQFEASVHIPEGERQFLVSKLPLQSHEGEVVGICAVAVDITALKQAENEIRILNQSLEKRVDERTRELAEVNIQLQDANTQLEAFSYTVAHDLRAPLRSMQGFADAVGEDYAETLDDTGQDYLRRISKAATRMERLIEDLLSFSRLSRMELSLGTVQLDEVLTDVLGNLRTQIAETHAKVSINSAMPAVRANRAACLHIFQNLLSNALKFSKQGMPPIVRIWADAGMPEQDPFHRVRIWVEDEGIGISEVHRERIFKPFERLHGIDEYPGSGIGLAVVDKAARRMQGRCGFDSTPGKGTRFWIELPLVNMET